MFDGPVHQRPQLAGVEGTSRSRGGDDAETREVEACGQGRECFHSFYLTHTHDGRNTHYFGVSFITVPLEPLFVQ